MILTPPAQFRLKQKGYDGLTFTVKSVHKMPSGMRSIMCSAVDKKDKDVRFITYCFNEIMLDEAVRDKELVRIL